MNDHTLFSARFQAVYTLLGIFSFRYIDGDSRGLRREQILSDSGLSSRQFRRYLDLLIGDGLIAADADGLLHLGRKFYAVSMWDLLVTCEPWMEHSAKEVTEDQTLSVHAGISRYVQFMKSEKLYRTYMEPMLPCVAPETTVPLYL